MSNNIDQYVYAAALNEIINKQNDIDQTFLDYETTVRQIDGRIRNEVDPESIEFVVNEFIRQGAISVIEDELAGKFYKIDISAIARLISAARERQDSLEYKYAVIGPAFLEAALRSARGQQEDRELDERLPVEGSAIPASDRIVTLNHNEISEFDERTSEIIEAAEALNSVDGEPGLREVIVGQLRAGRELIRAGSLRLYLLQITLFDTLKFLAQRYEHDAVGALASALLAALLAHFGLAA